MCFILAWILTLFMPVRLSYLRIIYVQNLLFGVLKEPPETGVTAAKQINGAI